MTALLEKTKKHCTQILIESRCNQLAFHNSQHTKEVFNNAQQIGTHENLTQEDLEIVSLAALFHDTGNMDCFKGHEDVSAHKASEYLKNIGFEPGKIEKVVKCILATKMPQKPTNLLEEVICDSDLAHLGKENFIAKKQIASRRMERAFKNLFQQ